MTLAERPHPFPSRTRKLSSPAPKILRGQPFGKIGRRRDFCVSGAPSRSGPRRPSAGEPGYPSTHDRGRSRTRAPRRPCPAIRPSGPSRRSSMCPYLAAADGAWRSTTVAREHRCGAVAPPALARRREAAPAVPDRRLTSSARHSRPPERPDRSGPSAPPTLPRPLARTTPVVLDHGRIAITIPALRSKRSVRPGRADRPAGARVRADPARPLSGGGAPAGVGRRLAEPACQRRRQHAASADRATSRRRATARPVAAAPSPASAAVRQPARRARPSGHRPRDLQGQGGRHADRHRREVRHDPEGHRQAQRPHEPVEPQVGQVLKIP